MSEPQQQSLAEPDIPHPPPHIQKQLDERERVRKNTKPSKGPGDTPTYIRPDAK